MGEPPQEASTALEGVTLHHEQVAAGDVMLHVVRAGAGPPVLLLHGFPEHWWAWRRQIPHLARAGYSVWVPDLRGYHQSGRPTAIAAYDLRHLATDVVAIVRATGAGRAHIAGHDWGGIIAWTVAGRYPELVDRLLILNAPHPAIYTRALWRSTQALRSAYVPFFALPWLPERTLRAGHFRPLRWMMRRLEVRRDALSDDDIDRYIAALSQPGALRAALAYYRANFRPRLMAWARATRVHAETLVIWGLADPALSPVLLDGLDSVVPRLHIHRVPDCGHWVHAEAAANVTHLMIAFLNRSTGDAMGSGVHGPDERPRLR